MTGTERDAKIAAAVMLDALTSGLSGLPAFYLSFATETEWLGGCLVHAFNAHAAVAASHALEVNPGGEVEILGPLPAEPPPEFFDRLLNRADLDAFDDHMNEHYPLPESEEW